MRPTFEDLVARGSIQHASARRRGLPPGLAVAIGVLLGLLLAVVPALLIYGGPS